MRIQNDILVAKMHLENGDAENKLMHFIINKVLDNYTNLGGLLDGFLDSNNRKGNGTGNK